MEPRRELPQRDLQANIAQLRRLNLPVLADFLEAQEPFDCTRAFAEVAANQALLSKADEGSPGVLPTEGDRPTMGEEARVGVKHDQDKPRYDLVPTHPLKACAEVFAFGAKKYGDRNWELGIDYGRLYGALQRHLNAFWAGEDLDPESNLSHIGHAMCCLMMMGEEHLNPNFSRALDDRPHNTVS